MDRTIQDLKPNHQVRPAEAISYSYNFAVSKPDIGATEKEHILGLCSVVKAQDLRAAHAEEAFSRESARADRLAQRHCGAAPQTMPEHVRLTIMAVVTGRMIQLRQQPECSARDYELSVLVPAAQWLTGETGQAERFSARGATYQYEVEAVRVDEFGHIERVDDDSQANTFGVYRRPRHSHENVARAEFLGDFDTRHAAQQAASELAVKDSGGAGEH